MNKFFSLLKACMSSDMSLFKIKNKNQSNKIMVPIVLTILCFFSIWSYANIIMEPLVSVHLEYVLLTLFIVMTSFLTLVEGIYKSGNLLFNCKDDNLLLALPLKKSTVLFVRIFKFYIFELIYNSLFLIPAMVVYIRYVSVGITFYISSLIAIFLLPIIPIIISCIIGSIISSTSSKFKLKNIAQIIFTTLVLLVVLYVSFNLEGVASKLSEKATNINEIVTKLYYPAGAYIKLITNFNIIDLVIFVSVHLTLFILMTIILSKIYFRINSKFKIVRTVQRNENYEIKIHKPMEALINKELTKFINSPVFVTNTAFGLVLFIIGCIGIALKFDGVLSMMQNQHLEVTAEQINSYIPVLMFGFICFTSLMSSITSSMISLEGKSFYILKSLPIKPFTIIISKVISALIIMLPFIFIGDIIVFIRFKFNIVEIIMILFSSVLLPLVSEITGILVNVKYPRMDAENDTQVVKQSMSSMISVLLGMILSGLTIFILIKALNNNISNYVIILGGLGIYMAICLALIMYLNKKGVEEFNKIN